MFMQAIEPSEIRIGRQPFPRCAETQVFYLGYGRNAWNATWINRYDPGSMSFNDADLRTAAEARRVQGSVFRNRNPSVICHRVCSRHVRRLRDQCPQRMRV